MVMEGIILGHKISSQGINFDQVNFEIIVKLPPSISIKDVRSFLEHTNFYRQFIKDFSEISHLMCKLLEKEEKFEFMKNV